jgi:hypothetical protein
MENIGTLGKVVVVVAIRVLHVSRSALLIDRAVVVVIFGHDPATAVQAVVHGHAPLGVMNLAGRAIGAPLNGAAVGSLAFSNSLWDGSLLRGWMRNLRGRVTA